MKDIYQTELAELYAQLRMLQESYAKDAEPIIKLIVEINSIRVPNLIVPLDQIDASITRYLQNDKKT